MRERPMETIARIAAIVPPSLIEAILATKNAYVAERVALAIAISPERITQQPLGVREIAVRANLGGIGAAADGINEAIERGWIVRKRSGKSFVYDLAAYHIASASASSLSVVKVKPNRSAGRRDKE